MRGSDEELRRIEEEHRSGLSKRYKGWLIGIGALILILMVGSSCSTGEDDLSPAVSSSPTTTAPTAIPSPTPTFEEARARARTVIYDELWRNNGQYIAKELFFRGKIVEVVSELSGDTYVLRVFVTEGNSGLWEDDIRLDYEGPRMLEDGLVEFTGIVEGLWRYEPVGGDSRPIPHMRSTQLR